MLATLGFVYQETTLKRFLDEQCCAFDDVEFCITAVNPEQVSKMHCAKPRFLDVEESCS